MQVRPDAPAGLPRAGTLHPRPAAGEAAGPPDSVALSPRARRLLSRGGARPPGKLGLGDSGPEVARLQQALVRWMPGWEGLLEADGVYGPRTARAVRFFKAVHGLGRDGASLDRRTRKALQEVETGTYWTRNPDGGRRYARLPEVEARYQQALRRGYPLRDPREGLAPREVQEVAARDPERLVTYRGHLGRARMWKRFLELEKAAAAAFPGHRLAITCTTGGEHQSAAHPDGRAVDFVLERVADGYRPDAGEFDSDLLAELAEKNGFSAFDEYRNGSLYRSGPHMHAEASW